MEYFTLLTKAGLASIADAIRNQTTVNITEMAFGDANGNAYEPGIDQEHLVNEKYRIAVNSITPDQYNPNWLIVEAILPSEVGNFYIQEVGLYAEGTLIAVSNYPRTYKPVVSDGILREMTIHQIIQVENADAVNMEIDPNISLATRQYVRDQIDQITVQGIKPFDTYADLLGYDDTPPNLAKNQFIARVSFDLNPSKNGLYAFSEGQWKSINDSFIDEFNLKFKQLSEAIFKNDSTDIYQFADKEQNIVARIDKDGMFYLVGLEQPIQLELNSKISSSNSTDIYQFTDKEQNIVARIDKDGMFYLVGLEQDLVAEFDAIRSEIANQSESIKDTSVALLRNYKDTFYQPMQTVLSSLLSAQTGAKAPPPLHLCPHNFTISKDWINQIQMYGDADSQIVRVNTPYHIDGGVVHPNVLEFYNGFRGYRYIACITPYHLTNEAEENPCIFGSHDLTSFEMLDGFSQPLDERPQPKYGTGHNSDNVLTYDPRSGELICVWRQTLRNTDGNGTRTDNLWMRKTKDGYNWTEKEEIFLNKQHLESGIAGSPAIIYDAKSGFWYMYLTKLGGNKPDDMRLFRNKNLHKDGWEYVATLTLPFNPWHQEVKIIGNKVCMLVYCFAVHTVYLGISDDYINFQWTENIYKDTTTGTYKTSFIPTFNDANEIALNIIYTTHADHPVVDQKWRLHVHKTNFIPANVELI